MNNLINCHQVPSVGFHATPEEGVLVCLLLHLIARAYLVPISTVEPARSGP